MPEIGVIGGSGLYSLLDDAVEVPGDDTFGPSGPLTIGAVDDIEVAFLARHGPGHRYPAHRVNYRANLWALRQAGVRAVFGPSACGSLRAELAPGDVVVCDQLVDRTSGRADTYFDTVTNHVSLADPYCTELRLALLVAARAEGMTAHDGGTMAVISGPRFSSRAESRWFAANGWDVVGMTQYPEAALAAELGIGALVLGFAGADETMCMIQMGTIPQQVMLETIRQFGHHVIPHFRYQEPAAVTAQTLRSSRLWREAARMR